MKVVRKGSYYIPTRNDVYIGRGSPLGNPYSHRHGTKAKYIVSTREKAIEKYEIWLRKRIQRNNRPIIEALKRIKEDSNLICFCKPLSCHGDVILKILNEPEWSEVDENN